jgi:hypothetical protein
LRQHFAGQWVSDSRAVLRRVRKLKVEMDGGKVLDEGFETFAAVAVAG